MDDTIGLRADEMRTLVTALVIACLLIAVIAIPALAVRFWQQELMIEMLLQRQHRPVPCPGVEDA